MSYPPGAVERAMKVQEVIVQALAGKLTWLQAAEILGGDLRSIRRMGRKFEQYGYSGLFECRRQTPSPKQADAAEVQRVLATYGIPMALYTDRAHWAADTPTAGGAVDRRRPTQVGRALARLGIEHILGYSPQARGRSERANRTLQGRLVNELRLAGITTVAGANRHLRERFLPAFCIRGAGPVGGRGQSSPSPRRLEGWELPRMGLYVIYAPAFSSTLYAPTAAVCPAPGSLAPPCYPGP